MDELKLGDLPIRVVTADLPHDTAAMIIGRVEPDEMLPGESVPEALVRLGRAVALKA